MTIQKTPGTKELILERALDLFADYGYEAVSTQQIASAIGITKGALYKHYESKRAIFDAILRRMEQTDALDAGLFNMPGDNDGPCNATADDLAAYSLEMFRYWTQDGFASRFRRMLTIEQHKSAEMQALMRQYLTDGPVRYVESVLLRMGVQGGCERLLAVQLYAPMFLLYDIEDSFQTIEAHLAETKRRIEALLK